jgi:hypothetical protein
VGIALAIVGLVLTVAVAYVVYARQRPRKVIEWWMWLDEALTDVDTRYIADSVRLAAEQLNTPRIVRLTVYNLGRDPVRREDWDIPATITFPNGRVAHVLTTTNSSDWDAESVAVDPHTVRLQPVLMNYFDKITLTLALDGETAGARMQCRIVGQTQDAVTRRSRSSGPSWWSTHVPEQVRTGLTVVLFVIWLVALSWWLLRIF